MATEGQVVGSLIQKTLRLKGQEKKVGGVFVKLKGQEKKVGGVFVEQVQITGQTDPTSRGMLTGKVVKTGRGVVLKGHIVKNFIVPDRVVTVENTGRHIDAIYGALSEIRRETKVFAAKVEAVPEKNAEQRTIEWLGSETERLRTLLSDRIDKDREHQKQVKAAMKALREGF